MFKRLNITLPEGTLARADAYAARERYSRSGLIAAALDAFTGGDVVAATEVREESSTYSPVAPDRHAAADPERIAELVGAFFAARDDVEAAWLFGSAARGRLSPLSDVDVAVLPRADADADERWRLRADLMARLPSALGGSEVDVLVLPDAGVLVTQRALVGGSRVFGRASRRAAEVEVRAATALWDFAPMLRMLDDRFGEKVGAVERDR